MRALAGVMLLGACSAPPAGVVSSASPEATRAGGQILEAGGNAIDAAVAVGFALAVTEPAMSGLGAGMQMLVQAPGMAPFVINGTSFSPAATPTEVAEGVITGHRATAIPTTVRTLDYALRRHGSGRISWADALAPAIRYAEVGFVVGRFRARVWARHQADLQASPSAGGFFLRADGTAPVEGDTVRQPVLARTLTRLAVGSNGADQFYRGAMAREIALDMEANGGWITLEDLASVPEPRELPALRSSYRGYDVASLASPASGWVVLQILNLLELSPADALAPSAASRPGLITEALLIGHASRRDRPITDLARYQGEAAERTAKPEARRLREAFRVAGRQAEERDSARGETTHYTVVDRDGMIVSVTTSINAYFGSRVVTPSLGFLYNDYMHEFELDRPGHPFALGPGRMPYSSMSASILSRDGVPVMGVGSPGSARIISAVAQVIQLWADGQATLADAVAMPRVHVQPPGSLYLEDPVLAVSSGRELEQRFGLRLRQPATDLVIGGRNAYFGGVHAVAFERGRWRGAADPRRDGAVGVARSYSARIGR